MEYQKGETRMESEAVTAGERKYEKGEWNIRKENGGPRREAVTVSHCEGAKRGERKFTP